MGRRFGGGVTTDVIDVAGWTPFTAATGFTIAMWVYVTSYNTFGRYVDFNPTTPGTGDLSANDTIFGGAFEVDIPLATTPVTRITLDSGVVPLNKWAFVAAMWDGGTPKTSVRIFVGNLGGPAAEVAYDDFNSTNGSGALQTMGNFSIGNRSSNPNRAIGGIIANLWYKDAHGFSLGQLTEIMYRGTVLSPRMFLPLYGLTSPEIDLIGSGLTGTVTGAVAAAHVPIPPRLWTPPQLSVPGIAAATGGQGMNTQIIG